MVTNLKDVNITNVNGVMDTIYKVIDSILTKSDGNAIALIKDMEELNRCNSIIHDIVESKVKNFVISHTAGK